MAPTEASILSNFLLSPASLPTIISLRKFVELFPRRLRSHPQVKALYRELQQQREQDMDQVNANIDEEIRRGEKQKAEVRQARRATGVDGMSADDQRQMDLDVYLFGQPFPHLSADDYHTSSSLLSAIEAACADIEREVADIDKEAAAIVSELNATVGDLSDLRYGKFQGPAGAAEDVVGETINGLNHLEDLCYRPSIP